MTKSEHAVLAKKRKKIDALDTIILSALAQRFLEVETIAQLKIKYDLPLRQKDRWEELLKERTVLGKELKLLPSFVVSLMKLIHKESLAQQEKLKHFSKDKKKRKT